MKTGFILLMRNIPSPIVALFTVSVVLMNILASKELGVLALDCGTLVSWVSFLAMDVITKRFGPKAAMQVSLFAIACNLLVCGVMFIAASIPGNWSAFYDYGLVEVNAALNSTFAGTWYILLGSTVAFLASAAVNATINDALGRVFTKSDFKAFAIRSYVSTLVAQFVDNFTFAMIVSRVFFGWSMYQVITCSIIGCVIELLCEVFFSPVGYKISKQWEIDEVGKQYLEVSK